MKWLRKDRLSPRLLPMLPSVFAPTLYHAPPEQITDHELRVLLRLGKLKIEKPAFSSALLEKSPMLMRCCSSSIEYQ